ncbi:hypothetical protein ACFLQV_01570 [Calditrichota bacterium]
MFTKKELRFYRKTTDIPRSLKSKLIYAVYLLIVVPTLTCAGYVLFRGHVMYNMFKHQRVWREGNPLIGDAKHGWTPQPNSEGIYHFYGETRELKFDSIGARVTESDAEGGVLLALGCSWTEGAMVEAEETFTAVAAKQLDLRPINMGRGGQGYSQMQMLAEEYVTKIRPDVVLIQYSDWLVKRSMRLYAPTHFGHRPNPYYSRNAAGNFEINPPVFYHEISAYPGQSYRNNKFGPLEYTSFQYHIGLPFVLRDLYMLNLTKLKTRLDMTPKPLEMSEGNQKRLTGFFYSKLVDLCLENDAKPVIVCIGSDPVSPQTQEIFENIDSAVVVNAVDSMYSQLDEPTREQYYMRYGFWSGDPPELVDKHPNAKSHEETGRLIADAIISIYPEYAEISEQEIHQ